MTLPLLPTTIVGSLPKPGWLTGDWYSVDERWSVGADVLHEALDDATRLALIDQRQAGIDIVCDGEQRRSTHYSYFLKQLDGIQWHDMKPKAMRGGKFTQAVPRVVGEIRLRGHQAVDDYLFLRRLTDQPIKMTLPGPSTLVDGTFDEYYGDPSALAIAYAHALNEEILALAAAGCSMVQLDEPVFTRMPRQLYDYGVTAMDRAFEGAHLASCVHVCYGYRARLGNKQWQHGYDEIFPALAASAVQQFSLEFAETELAPSILARLPNKTIQIGVIDVGTDQVESAQTVADRLRATLEYVPAQRLIAAPDCGCVARSREATRAKLGALVEGTRRVRDQL